jgi:hypothetical protein
MRRRLSALLAAATLVLTFAGSASAGPPDRFEDPFAVIFPDLQNELVVFINSDRATACTADVVAWEAAFLAWLEGGEVGPEPPLPEFPGGLDPIAIQAHETAQGAVIYLAKGSGLTMELWEMDADAPLIGPCTDTDDAMHRIAVGTGSYLGNDNDLFGSETRGNAFGDRGQGYLTDDAGNAYRYAWLFHINSRCYAPEDGPPACLLELATLQPR